MLSLVKPPISAARFDAQNQVFEHRFSSHSTFFRVVNTICAIARSFSDDCGLAEFKFAR